jgi:acyl-CoA reductase-like NAD-dependent aldehyde dehydrogenase
LSKIVFLINLLIKFLKDIKTVEDYSSDLGPMIMSANSQKVLDHLKEVEDRCTIVMGESDSKSMFISPSIVIEPPEGSRIINEETFGPVLSIRRFNDEKDLFLKIHKTGFGLSSSIFGKNKKRINFIARNIKAGSVSINDVMSHYGIASLPFGGEGLSGVGRIHGKEGLRSLCRTKSIVVNRFNFISEPWWFNRPKIVEKVLEKVVNYLYS